MPISEFQNLENQLKTLGNKSDLRLEKKQAVRDKIFRSIGQIELADAITAGDEKSRLAVSLKHLQQALIPHKLTFSMPATIMTVIVVFMGSIVTGAAAQGARPGDALFGMKKVIESIEVAIVSNPVKKAEKTLTIAGERLQYLENTLGTEKALNTVLQETQIALVSARATITKAKVDGNETEVALLLDKFNSLLADQKVLLGDIEKETTNEDVKKTIVAIRDVITGDKIKDDATNGNVSDSMIAVTSPVVPKTVVKPVLDTQKPLELDIALSGRQSLAGRIGTASGRIVLFVGNKYYYIINSPINLQLYVGNSNIGIVGDVRNGELSVYQIYADGKLVGENPTTVISLNDPIDATIPSDKPTDTAVPQE